jgi:hypothetical protein
LACLFLGGRGGVLIKILPQKREAKTALGAIQALALVHWWNSEISRNWKFILLNEIQLFSDTSIVSNPCLSHSSPEKFLMVPWSLMNFAFCRLLLWSVDSYVNDECIFVLFTKRKLCQFYLLSNWKPHIFLN